MRHIWIAFIFTFLQSTVFARSPAVLYTQEDLDLLYQKRQFTEYLAHAKDIRPTKRNTRWNKQVVEMAIEFVDDINRKKEFSEHNRNEVHRLMNLADVNKSELFSLARKTFLEGYLSLCFEQGKSTCLSTAEIFLKNTKYQRELPFIPAAMGEVLINNGINRPTIITPFMKYAFISERSNFLCKKEPVRNYIFNWFKEFNSSERSVKEIKLFTADNFNPKCINNVLNYYVKSFPYLNSPIDREQIIHWLAAISYLTEKEIDTMLAIYILKNPVNGDVFNKAWNQIKKIGENFEERKPIIEKLKSLDPLPDEIFNLGDPLRERTLFSHILKNLPEYINHYSKTCVDYYSGIKSFPNGNPAMKCRDFLRLMKAQFGEGHPKVLSIGKSLRL